MAAEPYPTGIQKLSTLGLYASIAGASMTVLGNFYNVKSMQSVTRQQAADLAFQSSMSNINARAAEFDAASLLAAGRSEGARLGLQYGQAKGAARASFGGRGIKVGKGSSAEALASIELSKRMDLYTVNSNAVRAANAARTQAQNFRTQGAMASVSAQNAYGTARSLSPGLSVAGSLLSGVSGIASQWLERSRYSNREGFGAAR